MKTKKSIFTSTTVDHVSGEVLESRWIQKQVTDSVHFLRTYLDDIAVLIHCNNSEKNVILAMLKYLEFDTNEVVLNATRRAEIVTTLQVSKATVDIAISRLYKKSILVKTDGKMYLNPKLFFYGSDIARASQLKLTIHYQFPNKEVIN